MKNDKLGKILRTITIILVGLTAAMNILGGVGTTCAAFLTKQFPPMWALMDYRWLYQLFVIATVAIGLVGVWTTIGLARGRKNAYRDTLIVLAAGTLVGAVHMIASLALRGKAVPANVKLYINALTLVYALSLRLPGLRERVTFSEESAGADRATAAGMAAIVSGFTVLSVSYWAAPSHTYAGENWVYVLRTPIYLTGGLLLVAGFILLARVVLDAYRQEAAANSSA
jgi:hypothetical protein